MYEDIFIPDTDRIIIDLHNMEKDEALFYLEKAIDTATDNIKEIVVIHGYRKGQAIMNAVRKEFIHKRIEKKIIPFNQGITLIYLKPVEK